MRFAYLSLGDRLQRRMLLYQARHRRPFPQACRQRGARISSGPLNAEANRLDAPLPPQIVSALASLHSRGLAHGSFCAASVLFNEPCWCGAHTTLTFWLTTRTLPICNRSPPTLTKNAISPRLLDRVQVAPPCIAAPVPPGAGVPVSRLPAACRALVPSRGGDALLAAPTDHAGPENEVPQSSARDLWVPSGGNEDAHRGRSLPMLSRSGSGSDASCSGAGAVDASQLLRSRSTPAGSGGAPAAVAAAARLAASVPLEQLMGAWQMGALSTFDYLVAVNVAAGRRWGDRSFHMASTRRTPPRQSPCLCLQEPR